MVNGVCSSDLTLSVLPAFLFPTSEMPPASFLSRCFSFLPAEAQLSPFPLESESGHPLSSPFPRPLSLCPSLVHPLVGFHPGSVLPDQDQPLLLPQVTLAHDRELRGQGSYSLAMQIFPSRADPQFPELNEFDDR